MRINYPAEFRLEVNRLEKEFLLSPQGKGWLLNSASRQDGTMMFADYRWDKGDYAKLPSFAADLLSRPLALLVAAGDPAALAPLRRQHQRFLSCFSSAETQCRKDWSRA